jgi:hypothetical protein
VGRGFVRIFTGMALRVLVILAFCMAIAGCGRAAPGSASGVRQTVVIGPDGTVRKVFRLEVAGHAEEVLEAVTHLS